MPPGRPANDAGWLTAQGRERAPWWPPPVAAGASAPDVASSRQLACTPGLDETLGACDQRLRLRVASSSPAEVAVAQVGGRIYRYFTLFSSSSVSWLHPQILSSSMFPFVQVLQLRDGGGPRSTHGAGHTRRLHCQWTLPCPPPSLSASYANTRARPALPLLRFFIPDAVVPLDMKFKPIF